MQAAYVLHTEDLEATIRQAVADAIREHLPAPRPASSEPKMLTIAEACDRLRCGKSKLYELRRHGDLPSVTVGGSVLFRVEDVDALLEREAQK